MSIKFSYAAGAAVGLSLLATAFSAKAAGLASIQVKTIVDYLRAFGADASVVANVQATLDGRRTGGSLSASPTSGVAPLSVAFTGNVSASGTYIIAFGDGSNSGPLNSRVPPWAGVPCSGTNPVGCSAVVTSNHTYAAAGTYTAILEPYMACMWSNPRCMVAAHVLGRVTTTVVGSRTPAALAIPGSVTLVAGRSATFQTASEIDTLTLNAVHYVNPRSTRPGVSSADLSWNENRCTAPACANNPMSENFTLYLTGTTIYGIPQVSSGNSYTCPYRKPKTADRGPRIG